jgi:hypothetical protein
VVAELTRLSFTIFDMQKMQFMMKHTHIMAFPTAYPIPKFNQQYLVAQERLNLNLGHEQSVGSLKTIAISLAVKMDDACSNHGRF